MTEVDPSEFNQDANELLELVVVNLGVIEHASIIFNSGMTAITGETGAGKTLIVTALQLLAGQRADASYVGPFGHESRVEARFAANGQETVLSRVIPRDGRSRAYINGGMANLSALSELTIPLIEIHGQHGHTGLENTKEQREALDKYASIDLSTLNALRNEEKEMQAKIERLTGNVNGGNDLELLKFQSEEIRRAEIEHSQEDEQLKELEALLSDATGNQMAALKIAETLNSGGRVVEELSSILHELKNRESLKMFEEKVLEILETISEVASEARTFSEQIDANPNRLQAIQERRALLTDLRRKYGPTLKEVLKKQEQLQQRIHEIEEADTIAEEIQAAVDRIREKRIKEEAKIGKARAKAAPEIAERIETILKDLSLPNAQVKFAISGTAGEEVQILVSLNRGQELQPLQKVASGGELSRTMLALRLVLSDQPATTVFDEVDAGVGGEAAHSIGASLKKLATDRQILVVTHLAQVAAFADTQICITKTDQNKTVGIETTILDHEQRVIEISRMLSGSPQSDSARKHARELLKNTSH